MKESSKSKALKMKTGHESDSGKKEMCEDCGYKHMKGEHKEK